MFSRTETNNNQQFAVGKHNFIYDPYFSFTTIDGIKRRSSISSKNLKIGICISGSSTYANINDLINICTSSTNVASVVVHGDLKKSEIIINKKPVTINGLTDNIWEGFKRY